MKWLVWILCFCSASAIAGTIYRTVDANGKVLFTDQKPVKGKITSTYDYSDLPSTPVPNLQNQYSNRPEGDRKLPPPRITSQPVLFYAQWCGYCRKAKAYLSEKNIEYRGYDIDTPDGAGMFAKTGGKAIPLLIDGTKSQQGFSRSGYDYFFSH